MPFFYKDLIQPTFVLQGNGINRKIRVLRKKLRGIEEKKKEKEKKGNRQEKKLRK